jgi:hypothetical protein
MGKKEVITDITVVTPYSGAYCEVGYYEEIIAEYANALTCSTEDCKVSGQYEADLRNDWVAADSSHDTLDFLNPKFDREILKFTQDWLQKREDVKWSADAGFNRHLVQHIRYRLGKAYSKVNTGRILYFARQFAEMGHVYAGYVDYKGQGIKVKQNLTKQRYRWKQITREEFDRCVSLGYLNDLGYDPYYSENSHKFVAHAIQRGFRRMHVDDFLLKRPEKISHLIVRDDLLKAIGKTPQTNTLTQKQHETEIIEAEAVPV